jgi:hypothetical protein
MVPEPQASLQSTTELRVGMRVRVTQRIDARHYALVAPVEGTVIDLGQRPTGSWFAHGRADRLWLERLVLRKADGEVTTLNLDESSRIEVLADTSAHG